MLRRDAKRAYVLEPFQADDAFIFFINETTKALVDEREEEGRGLLGTAVSVVETSR